MAELTPCIDCGHQTSRSAFSCPKCRSPKPHGVACPVCEGDGGTLLSIKKAHKHPHSDTSPLGPWYYHPACIRGVLTIPTNAVSQSVVFNYLNRGIWKNFVNTAISLVRIAGYSMFSVIRAIAPAASFRFLSFHKMGYHENAS